jgi:tetratricopeptide (TPR) repeat protein
MSNRAFLIALAALAAAGCASTPPEPLKPTAAQAAAPAPSLWLDSQFAYDPSLVTVKREDLFRLDPELEAKLADPAMHEGRRLHRLLTTIFGPNLRAFGYVGGHSTIAAETWRNRKGDCLSLTVLTYSVARKLGMSAQMQEVQTAAIFDRRGQFDMVNQHVNVLFYKTHLDLLEEFQGRDVIIDFEPDFASGRKGTPLNEDGIVARYYNNVAVESMAAGRFDVAYAHFRAAIAAQPDYASAYSNLAVLYRKAGHDTEAERLLRRAVALDSTNSDVALYELHRLLVDTDRPDEAREIARKLEARRAADPYYWTGLGLKHLQEGDPRAAIDALLKAREIAPGFSEIHRSLAIAYAQVGERTHANDELAALASVGAGADKVAMLRRKLGLPNR